MDGCDLQVMFAMEKIHTFISTNSENNFVNNNINSFNN